MQNPPLLVVSDFTSFRIHTNFTNAPHETHSFNIESLEQPVIYGLLKNVFREPEALRPKETVERITQKTAGKLAEIAHLAIRRNEKYAQQNGLPTEGIAESVARYLDRIVFCLFAEDIGLLGDNVFTQMVERYGHNPKQFAGQTAELFKKMSEGGFFGITSIPHFNGSLFVNEPVIELAPREIEAVREAARLDWKDVDPSIFGTLFEHGLNTDERSLLGAHYTGRDDIQTLVEPVIMAPLRREWNSIHAALEQVEEEIASGQQTEQDGRREQVIWMEKWLSRLEQVRVLDPACGSGNFLSVTLTELLNLEKTALNWATNAGVRSLDGERFQSRVRPEMMLGIEVNSYAQDLARTVVQITYLQWLNDNGYPRPREPILRHTDNIWHHDALFDFNTGVETQWPDAEFIVGNPPFLGGSKIWRELGQDYQHKLWSIFNGRVRGSADLCCYWFDKAARHIEGKRAKRAGLVATQAIRGGANREVLETVKDVGDIFFAVSDKNWAIKGTSVHISLVAFDDGTQQERVLDERPVERIFTNLTSTVDVTEAYPLPENEGICFIGTKKAGDFNLPENEALMWLDVPNPHGKPNSDVLRPWGNGKGFIQSRESQWIIDTGIALSKEEFELYEQPYFAVDARVRPARATNNRPLYREKWWLHAETRPGMRRSLSKLPRYISIVAHSKHLIFLWVSPEILCDGGVFVFAYHEDYFLGILHSRIHEVWARSQGTQVRERESGFRYTPTTCFENFPFPKSTEPQKQAISDAAATLHTQRENWLNPREWMKEEAIEFRASANGPWKHHLIDGSVSSDGVGMARWIRLVPISPNKPVQDFRFDPRSSEFRNHPVLTKDALSRRTLTNLYNHPPAWLQTAHRALDEAVFAAYGWATDLAEEEILDRLLQLNLGSSGHKHDDVPSLPPEENAEPLEELSDAD